MPFEQQLILIRGHEIWSQLSEEEYEELNLVHRFLEANRNDYIYFDAMHHNKLYFLKEGLIKIGYIDENGNEITKEIIRKGEVFGQLTLEKNNLYGEFAKAHKSSVSLCAFTIGDFEKILQRKPYISIKYSRLIGHQLKKAESRLMNLLHKDVRTRLLHFIFASSESISSDPNTAKMERFLTHEDMAQLIGSTRQTVTAVLNELDHAGLLKIGKRAILIPDVKALQNLISVS